MEKQPVTITPHVHLEVESAPPQVGGFSVHQVGQDWQLFRSPAAHFCDMPRETVKVSGYLQSFSPSL